MCSDPGDGNAIILNPVRRIRSSVQEWFRCRGDEHEAFRKEIVKSVHREWKRSKFRKLFDRGGHA